VIGCLHPARMACVLIVLLRATGGASASADDGPAPGAEAYLIEGKLTEGERALAEFLKANPDNDQCRFGLGVVQFLRAIEARVQSLYRHGFRSEPGMLGGIGRNLVTNLPVPLNPRPEPLSFTQARALLKGWVDDLGKVEATLAGVKDPGVKLPLRFGLIRLDLNGDGRAEDDEMLWKLYARLNRAANLDDAAARGFLIAFDRGDVDWLRGYCHLLSAVAEAVLAYDFEAPFLNAGHLFFRGVKPFSPVFATPRRGNAYEMGEVLDLIAMIHLIRLPVVEPQRLKGVLGHLEAMVALSRSSWKAILAEKDDDHEWLPNPKQGSVLPNGKVSAEMVEGWNTFLDEFASILAGRKLLPFWRGENPRLGLNARRILTDPRPLDLVLWVQGSAALPYLEEGDLTSAETWQRLNRIFQGEFIGFALWFN
jgi:hypothetical protein